MQSLLKYYWNRFLRPDDTLATFLVSRLRHPQPEMSHWNNPSGEQAECPVSICNPWSSTLIAVSSAQTFGRW